MRYKFLFFILFFVVINHSICSAQEEFLYKQIDTTNLFMAVHYPDLIDTSKNYSAIVFFFGGGWKGGDKSHFQKHAEYFSKRGLVCFLADYRTANKHNTTPFECLKDAKSAIRFLRKNSSDFRIDANKIIASGGSAGGHLAAATSLIDDYNESTDDLTVSCIPNAMILFNPVIDNGPGGYGYERIGKVYKDFSPLHNINQGAPPTIFFLGSNDALIPVTTAENYKKAMEEVGSRCDLKLYEGQRHGFFNYRNFEYFKKTILEADQFLQSLGYLGEEPRVKIE